MKARVFIEKDKIARKQLMVYRIALLEQMALMTTDEAILAGLGRLRKQLSMKWNQAWKGKTESSKKSFKKAQLDTLSKATNHYRSWTEEELLKLSDLEIVDRDLALLLGRTLQSVRSKRRKLYKLGDLTK